MTSNLIDKKRFRIFENDLCIDVIVPLKNVEHDDLATGPSFTDTWYAYGEKVGFIEFDNF